MKLEWYDDEKYVLSIFGLEGDSFRNIKVLGDRDDHYEYSAQKAGMTEVEGGWQPWHYKKIFADPEEGKRFCERYVVKCLKREAAELLKAADALNKGELES